MYQEAIAEANRLGKIWENLKATSSDKALIAKADAEHMTALHVAIGYLLKIRETCDHSNYKTGTSCPDCLIDRLMFMGQGRIASDSTRTTRG